jgi:hypothetical protein
MENTYPDPEKIIVSSLFLPDANNIEQEVEVCNIKDTIKYLGVPVHTRKLQKIKFNKCRIGGRGSGSRILFLVVRGFNVSDCLGFPKSQIPENAC